jgi:hypothetical protein
MTREETSVTEEEACVLCPHDPRAHTCGSADTSPARRDGRDEPADGDDIAADAEAVDEEADADDDLEPAAAPPAAPSALRGGKRGSVLQVAVRGRTLAPALTRRVARSWPPRADPKHRPTSTQVRRRAAAVSGLTHLAAANRGHAAHAPTHGVQVRPVIAG